MAMYMDRRYRGARVLEKIDPMLRTSAKKDPGDRRRGGLETYAAPAELPINWFSPTAVLRLK